MIESKSRNSNFLESMGIKFETNHGCNHWLDSITRKNPLINSIAPRYNFYLIKKQCKFPMLDNLVSYSTSDIILTRSLSQKESLDQFDFF